MCTPPSLIPLLSSLSAFFIPTRPENQFPPSASILSSFPFTVVLRGKEGGVSFGVAPSALSKAFPSIFTLLTLGGETLSSDNLALL